jgi:hypothetical protein
MIFRRSHLGRIAILAAVALSGLTAPALGAGNSANTEKQPPYDVTGLKHSRIWVPWIFAFIFGAGAVAVGVKNPHRSHGERA